MKKAFLVFLGIALLFFMATDASAVKNANGKWALHYAGAHDAKGHTCAFDVTSCTDINVVGPGWGARIDIYVIAVDVQEIGSTRYGISCNGPFWIYGWTKCSDFEIPTAPWPRCGEGNAQTWVQGPGPHVTVGILDLYVYPESACICTCVDPRVGYAEFCDSSAPSPICFQTYGSDPRYFGCIGFNGSGCGHNPCGIVPTEQRSWGAVKSLYR